MHFSTLFTVFAGLSGISSALGNTFTLSRDTVSLSSHVQKERSPAHARDFSLKKRANTELFSEDPAASDPTSIAAVGVNGCSGIFIWAGDVVFGKHTAPANEAADMQDLQNAVTNAGLADQIVNVAICSPAATEDAPDTGLPLLKNGLTWTDKTPELTTYPFVLDDSSRFFELSAEAASPGQVTVSVTELSDIDCDSNACDDPSDPEHDPDEDA